MTCIIGGFYLRIPYVDTFFSSSFIPYIIRLISYSILVNGGTCENRGKKNKT